MDFFEELSGKKLFNKRNIATLLVIGIVVLSIPIGLNLFQQRQEIRSKAIDANLLEAGMQDVVLDTQVATNHFQNQYFYQNVQWFTLDSDATMTLAGKVQYAPNTVISGYPFAADIQVDVYPVDPTSHTQRIVSYSLCPGSSRYQLAAGTCDKSTTPITFTVPKGQSFAVILRSVNARVANFSNVDLRISGMSGNQLTTGMVNWNAPQTQIEERKQSFAAVGIDTSYSLTGSISYTRYFQELGYPQVADVLVRDFDEQGLETVQTLYNARTDTNPKNIDKTFVIKAGHRFDIIYHSESANLGLISMNLTSSQLIPTATPTSTPSATPTPSPIPYKLSGTVFINKDKAVKGVSILATNISRGNQTKEVKTGDDGKYNIEDLVKIGDNFTITTTKLPANYSTFPGIYKDQVAGSNDCMAGGGECDFQYKLRCDGSNNGVIDEDDFGIWIKEFTGLSNQKIMDCNIESDGVVDLLDFNTWRNLRYKL